MPSDAESQAAMDVQAPPPGPTPLATHTQAPLATTGAPLSFSAVLDAVGRSGLSAEAVATVTEAFLKAQAFQAKQQYNEAFAAFRKECPPPPRDHVRKWEKAGDTGGGWTTYYADMETILRTVQPVLAMHDLSISFDDAELKEMKGAMVLTERCRCSHVGGHSESASSPMTLESSSPAMGAQDRYDGASTRAQRRALCKVLGIWTESYNANADSKPAEPSPLLTDDQRQHIASLALEVNQNWDDLTKWWGIEEVKGVRDFRYATQDKYTAAVRFLEQKKAKQAKGTK